MNERELANIMFYCASPVVRSV